MNYKKIFGELPRNWTVGTLDQYAEVIDPHPSHRAPSEVSDGYPFLGIGDLDYYGNATFDKARHVGLEIIEEHEHNYKITETSIGYAKMGNTIGKVVSFPSRQGKTRFAVSPALSVINPNDQINPYYLRAVVESNAFWGQVNGKITGSTRPSIGIQQLRKILIPLPPDAIQERIGEIWKAIYDKISVNTNINDNLQQQVQTLFADWLSANSGSATEVALGDVCTKVTDGSHFSPKDDPTSSIPMLSVKDMREFDFDLTSCKHICEDDYEKMVANDCVPQINDILVAKDGSYLKEIFICNEQRKLAILSSIAIFRPNATVIHPEILLAFLKSPRVLREVRDNYVSGSALPRIVLKDFKKLTFALPNMDAQNLIAPLFASIREQIDVNVAENKYMAQLRDALLPKLMSGELNISKIDL